MRAAEDDGVDRDLEIRRELFKEICRKLLAAQNPLLDELHQAAARDGDDLGLLFILRAERLEFLFLDGHGRRHDEDTAAGMPLDRGLERRLRADDGHVRKFGAQCIGRGGSRGVTGDDDGLCAFVQQMLHDRAATRDHLVHGFHTVGRVE